jgi:transposase
LSWENTLGIIKMSERELTRGEWIARVVAGECPQKRAAKKLGLSVRQIKRLCRKYRNNGISGIAHKGRGKISNRRISADRRKQACDIVTENYPDFGPQLAKEVLEKRHELKFSREWLRQLMIEAGLWNAKQRKSFCVHQRRERRSCEGELVQIDGSYHEWFEDRGAACCLINMIDDATGKLKELRFVEHESTQAYFETTRSYVLRNGCPGAMYSDRHSIFKGTKNDSQFCRALKELGIELILAHSPQAKGRVERSHATLQDRLIKLMRIEGISSMEDGNRFLERYREEHNSRFSRLPKSAENAHALLSPEQDLDRILCVKEKRKISKQLTVQYSNKTYQLNPRKCCRRMIGRSITIYEIGGKVVLDYEGEKIGYSIYEEQPHVTVMDRKRLDAFLDRKVPMSIIQRHRKGDRVNF